MVARAEINGKKLICRDGKTWIFEDTNEVLEFRELDAPALRLFAKMQQVRISELESYIRQKIEDHKASIRFMESLLE